MTRRIDMDPRDWEAVVLERDMGDALIWIVRHRSWRERWLSWPWRPWQRVAVVILQQPSP